jgi:hypothetical protein
MVHLDLDPRHPRATARRIAGTAPRETIGSTDARR